MATPRSRSFRQRAAQSLLTALVLIIGMPSFGLAATPKPKVTMTAQAGPTGIAAAVQTKGVNGSAKARLQRKSGRRWITQTTKRLVAGRASLRWSAAEPGVAYRLRAQVLRGRRVIGTSRSLVIKVAADQPTPTGPVSSAPPKVVPQPGSVASPQPDPAPELEPVPEIAPKRLSLGGGTGCKIEGVEEGVRCWGDGSRGQLGNGKRDGRSYAAAVPGMTDARAVAVGGEHVCAALRDGSVWCWGENFRAQLGGATTAQSSAVPVRVPGVSRVLSLVSGSSAEFTCVNRLDRVPLCWGTVPADLFGPGLAGELATPTPIPTLEGATIVAASDSRVCVRWTGRAATPTSAQCLAPNPAEWGRTDAGETHGASEAVRDLAPGRGGSCALLDAGKVRCEASARYGYADPVNDPSDWISPRVLTLDVPQAIDVATGSHTACVTRTAAAVRCWGTAPFATSAPFDVPGTAGVVALEADGDSYCGADAAGTVRCWGAGSFPATMGSAFVEPVPLELDGDLKGPAMSWHMGCALRNNAVECWGRTPGTNPTGTYDARRPTPIAGTTGVVEVVVSRETACGRRADGKVLCWGWLPRDMTSPGVWPDRVDAPATVVPDLDGVTQLAAGTYGLCALRGGAARGIVCLGMEGRRGSWTPGSPRGIEPGTADAVQFDVGDAVDSGYGAPSICFTGGSPSMVRCLRDGATTPVPIAGTEGSSHVGLGTNHGCAVVTDGRVRCWGLAHDALGYVAEGVLYTDRVEDAREVPGISGATALALGFSHTCAIVGSGNVWCWGDNDQGVLGQPRSIRNTSVPQRVPRVSDAATIASSESTICTTRASHALTCWGAGSYTVPRPWESDWWLGARLVDERDLPPLAG